VDELRWRQKDLGNVIQNGQEDRINISVAPIIDENMLEEGLRVKFLVTGAEINQFHGKIGSW
jgi:hypothetical protein